MYVKTYSRLGYTETDLLFCYWYEYLYDKKTNPTTDKMAIYDFWIL